MNFFRGSIEALEFAQTKLTPFGKIHKYVEKLEVRHICNGPHLQFYFFKMLKQGSGTKDKLVDTAGLYGFTSL